MLSDRQAGAVAVVVEDTPCVEWALRWAAEEADLTHRTLLLAHATGHLSPQLTYGERHLVREGRLRQGRLLLEDAARFVAGITPLVRVDTLVRLTDPRILLPQLAADAELLVTTQRSPATRPVDGPGAPALAVVDDSLSGAAAVAIAAAYAGRRGSGVDVLELSTPEAGAALVEASVHASLVVFGTPERHPARGRLDWPTVLDLAERAACPVAVTGDRRRQPMRRRGPSGRYRRSHEPN